jgi:putative transposase
LSCDDVPLQLLPPTGRKIGIDVGVARFATTSDGKVIASPAFTRRAGADLAAAQQALARKKQGSANRRRAKAKVAEVHRRIRNRRSDFHHKTARSVGHRSVPEHGLSSRSHLFYYAAETWCFR